KLLNTIFFENAQTQNGGSSPASDHRLVKFYKPIKSTLFLLLGLGLGNTRRLSMMRNSLVTFISVFSFSKRQRRSLNKLSIFRAAYATTCFTSLEIRAGHNLGRARPI